MKTLDEKSFTQGNRMAWWAMLGACLRELGYDETKEDPIYKVAMLTNERESAISALRSLCNEFGDNDWPENLSMADIINKHLGNHLHESATDG